MNTLQTRILWYCIELYTCDKVNSLKLPQRPFQKDAFPLYDFYVYYKIALALSYSHLWQNSDLWKLSISIQLQQTASQNCIQGNMDKDMHSIS